MTLLHKLFERAGIAAENERREIDLNNLDQMTALLNQVSSGKAKGVHVLEHRHELWCKTLNGGSGADCNCPVELRVRRVR